MFNIILTMNSMYPHLYYISISGCFIFFFLTSYRISNIYLLISENASPIKNYIQQTPEQISTIQFENEISPVATNGNLNRPCAWQSSEYNFFFFYYCICILCVTNVFFQNQIHSCYRNESNCTRIHSTTKIRV